MEIPMIAITDGPGEMATKDSAAQAKMMLGQAAAMSVQNASMF